MGQAIDSSLSSFLLAIQGLYEQIFMLRKQKSVAIQWEHNVLIVIRIERNDESIKTVELRLLIAVFNYRCIKSVE